MFCFSCQVWLSWDFKNRDHVVLYLCLCFTVTVHRWDVWVWSPKNSWEVLYTADQCLYTCVDMNESLWGRFKLLYSSSHCRTGQSQRMLIIYGANHQRAEQRGTKFVGAEFECVPESRIDHCWLEVVPHVPAISCVHHTHRYKDT